MCVVDAYVQIEKSKKKMHVVSAYLWMMRLYVFKKYFS